VAYEVLRRVGQGGAYATLAGGGALERHDLPPETRGAVTELVLGVLRHRTRLDRALATLAPRGLDALSPAALTIMRVAAYQLLCMRLPAALAVDHAVRAMREVGGDGLSRFANAVLRRLSRDGEPPPPAGLAERLELLHSLPPWLGARLRAAVGDDEAEAAAAAFNRPPGVTLRVLLDRADREAVAAEIARERPSAEIERSPLLPEALLLRGGGSPDRLAAFAGGRCTVQDVAAQLVARLVGPAPGERILDACAGVGGKSAHLATLARMAGGRATLDAADTSQRKLDLGSSAARRLGLDEITSHCVDLTAPVGLAPRYDRILLDAPCSGLGVIRRHPEAKWRETGAAVPALAALQAQLLDAIAPRLAVGGVMVYSVCTFTVEEGPAQITAFLARHPDFALVAPPDLPGVDFASTRGPMPGTLVTWPHRHDADAFFAARLVRR
jgi:16S rRNA (cytosine967-C5)-methyltransferase